MAGARSSIPIVALTASASSEVRFRCMEAGMNDFLSKPMEVPAVRLALERWCLGSAGMTVAPGVSEPA